MGLPENKQIIRKSNDLIEARYRLSIAEQRLVLLLAAEISPDDEDFKDYELRVNDFVRMFGLETDKSIYEQVEQAADNLLGKIITLQEGKEIEKTVWLSYVKYKKGSGAVKIRFDKSLKPYLLQLQGHFTQYNIKHVVGFKSQYSIRLYELLKMEAFKAKNGCFEKTFELVKLREFLGIGKKEYAAFDNLNRRVIQPSVKEISAQTDLNITDIKKICSGRKIIALTFVVSAILDDKKDILPNSGSASSISTTHPIIELLVTHGFSDSMAKTFKNKYGVKRIERNVAYALAKKQEGAIKDFPAYLNIAIKDDLGNAWEAEQAKQATEQAQHKITLSQREQQLTLLEEQSKRENDRRMQAMLKERGLDTSFDQDELSLMLEQIAGIKVQRG